MFSRSSICVSAQIGVAVPDARHGSIRTVYIIRSLFLLVTSLIFCQCKVVSLLNNSLYTLRRFQKYHGSILLYLLARSFTMGPISFGICCIGIQLSIRRIRTLVRVCVLNWKSISSCDGRVLESLEWTWLHFL